MQAPHVFAQKIIAQDFFLHVLVFVAGWYSFFGGAGLADISVNDLGAAIAISALRVSMIFISWQPIRATTAVCCSLIIRAWEKQIITKQF